MTFQEFIMQTLQMVLGCLLTVMGAMISIYVKKLIMKLNNNIENESIARVMERIDKIISQCVDTTTQTYVSTMKENGTFNAEAQKVAFDKTFDEILKLLSTNDMSVLNNYTSDVTLWLQNKIESAVLNSK